MTNDGERPDSVSEPAVLLYQAVCLGALGLIVLPLMARGLGLLEVFLFLLGLGGVALRLRVTPVLLLLTLAAAEMVHPLAGFRHRIVPLFQVSDFLLACGAVAYIMGHYRLQGLAKTALPVDRRQRERPGEGASRGRVVRRPRSAHLVTAAELLGFVLTVPLWAAAAAVFWAWLSRRGEALGLPLTPPEMRLVLVFWLLGVGGLVVAWLLSCWRSRGLSREEAQLFLQDTLWRETRREQRRLQRWLAWARLRQSPRREDA
jgi:hypothetical protein